MRDLMTVVVGFDGSPNGQDAVRVAADLVADGGTVHVVTAYKEPSAAEMGRMWDQVPAEYRGSFDVLSEPQSHRDVAMAMLSERDVTAVDHLVADDAASAIMDTADEVHADLIVVGSRGLGRGTRILRGSVSSKVASHATTSFLVVRAED